MSEQLNQLRAIFSGEKVHFHIKSQMRPLLMVNNSKAKKEGFYGRSKKAFINFFSFHMVSYNKGLGFLKVYLFSLFSTYSKRKLIPWLRLILKNQTILETFYTSWSYVVKTGNFLQLSHAKLKSLIT